jgi:signal transduction histidine kinase
MNTNIKPMLLACHEFKSPLANINSLALNLKKHFHELSFEVIEEMLSEITQQVKHMTHVMEDVLSMRTPLGISTSLSFISIEVFITRICDEVVITYKNTHCVELNFNLSNNHYLTDEKLLRSIILNLVGNAIKFSPQSNKILLSVCETNENLQIEVIDSGIGIPQQEQAAIFEPFHRGNNAGSFSGVGLGLSIVKKACEALQGQIKVLSQPKKGSTFTVQLPIKASNCTTIFN